MSAFGVNEIASVDAVPVAVVVTTVAQVVAEMALVAIADVPLATVRGIVALALGNVIVVESVPARVMLLLAVSVFDAAIVSVPVPVVNVLPFTVVATSAPMVCVPVKVLAASVRAIVADVEGNVITVLSVPASVRVLLAVKVLPEAMAAVPADRRTFPLPLEDTCDIATSPAVFVPR